MIPILLVAAQFVCAGALVLSGRWIARDLPWQLLESAGIAVVVWGVWAMGLRQLRVTPVVSDSAQLVTRGPYRWIRHPMYTGVLLATLALVVDDWTGPRFIVWCALVFILLAKLTYEERLLRQRFPEYAAYCRGTKRLIPYLF